MADPSQPFRTRADLGGSPLHAYVMQRRLAAGSRWPSRDDLHGVADPRLATSGLSWVHIAAGVACLVGVAAVLRCLNQKE